MSEYNPITRGNSTPRLFSKVNLMFKSIFSDKALKSTDLSDIAALVIPENANKILKINNEGNGVELISSPIINTTVVFQNLSTGSNFEMQVIHGVVVALDEL